MRTSWLAVLLLSSWAVHAQAQDLFEGACTPGRYDADKGLDSSKKTPECYTREGMIAALSDLRAFPVIMASSSQSKTTTTLFTFNPQSHEGYQLLLNAPIITCSRAKELGAIDQCPDPKLLDAFGATKAIVVDHYDQAQFMDIAAKGARSFNHDSNVMLRFRSLSKELPFIVAKTHHGEHAGNGFLIERDEPLEKGLTYEFIDYTVDGKALLGNP